MYRCTDQWKLCVRHGSCSLQNLKIFKSQNSKPPKLKLGTMVLLCTKFSTLQHLSMFNTCTRPGSVAYRNHWWNILSCRGMAPSPSGPGHSTFRIYMASWSNDYILYTARGSCGAPPRDYARAQKRVYDCFDSKLGCVVVKSYAADNKSVVCMRLYGSRRWA